MYDVTIVGAGPGGSTAAKFLSEAGFKVLLIDKDKFPRDKPCGGGLTANVLKRYKNLITENMIESYSYGGFTYSPSLKYKLDFETNYPVTGMIIRKKFDHELVKIAVEKGSTLKEKKKVIDLKISKDKAIVFLDDKTKIESQIVIGADGVWSIIAKKAGLRSKNIPIGVCVVEEYELTEYLINEYFGKLRKGYIHSKFQNLAGYGWVFPKKKHINIGVGEIEYNPQKQIKTNLKKVYEDYLNLLKKQKIIPDQIKIKRLKGGALPVHPLKKTYSERVLLVGDAGGFINPSSGEGIYYAMASGEIAAKTIQKALTKGDTSERCLKNYQKNWKKEFGKELKLFYWLSKRQRRTKSEKNFRLLNNDKKLNQLLADVSSGNKSVDEYKWKILKRYIYCSMKDRFSKS